MTDGLHLVGHLQHLVKVGAEAGHVLEEGLLLHLDSEVGQTLLLEDGCHLDRRGGMKIGVVNVGFHVVKETLGTAGDFDRNHKPFKQLGDTLCREQLPSYNAY